MKEVPVFLVTGFLEGGKSTFVKEIFNDPEFAQGENITLIVCENGIEEYEESFLKKHNVTLVNVKSKEDFTELFLKECNKENKPSKVIIEYNGMWEYEVFERIELPEGWELAQSITPIDASTFESYMNNMKSLLIEQFKNSDLIIFNRCTENTNKLKYRNSVKALNGRASMIFELESGEIDDSPLELPFDLEAPVIEFKDYDYGVWYLDITELPEKYEGKNIKVKGFAGTNPNYPKNIFAFGRNAMTCCEDDIAFLGLLCQTKEPIKLDGKKWVEIEGVICNKFIENQQRNIPFIAVNRYKFIEKLEDDLIYF